MASTATVSIILKMIDKASGTMNKVGSSSKKLSTNMKSLGTSMTRNVSLPLLAIGAAGIKMAVDLDKSMRNIQAFGGQSEDQIKALSQTFKDMSLDAKNGTQSAQQLADAYFNIQSAGFLGAEGMEVLAVSARAATAGLTTTQKASEGIMTVLNAYGLAAEDAAKVSDSLFTIVKLGVITFEQLIPTLGSVVPLANAMGIEFNELGAAYVVMTKQGLNASEAATQQKAVMTQLLAPSEALQKQMQALGFASGQAMVDSLGLLGTLDALGDAVGNDATQMQKLFVNTRAVQGAIALTGENAEKATIAFEEMQKAGAAQEAFNTQMQSFSAQFSIFKNTLGVFLIDVGEKLLPILMKLMESVRGAFKAWQDMDSGVQTVIVGIGAFLAIGGPLLIFFGAIFGAIGTIAGGFAALAGALGLTAAASAPAAVGIGATATATTALAIPLSAILIPLGLLTAAFIALTATSPEIQGFLGGVAKGIGDIVKGATSMLSFGIGKQTGDAYGAGLASGVAEGATAAISSMENITQTATQILNEFGVQVNASTLAAATEIINTGNVSRQTLNALAIYEDSALTDALLGINKTAAINVANVMYEGINAGVQASGESLNQLGQAVNQVASHAASTLSRAVGGYGIGGKFVQPTGSGPGGVHMQSIASGNYGVANQQAINQQFAGQDAAGLAAVQAIMGQSGGGGGGGSFASMGAIKGGDVNITIENLNVPAGTPKEAVDFIWKEIAKRMRKRGV